MNDHLCKSCFMAQYILNAAAARTETPEDPHQFAMEAECCWDWMTAEMEEEGGDEVALQG